MPPPPRCPTCGQPASEALGGPEHDWECRNEACPEYGQPVRADEPAITDVHTAQTIDSRARTRPARPESPPARPGSS